MDKSRSDSEFLDQFEDCSLAFEQWTHKAHLRVAFAIVKKYGIENAFRKLSECIQKYNAKHAEKIKRGYHVTITRWWTEEIVKRQSCFFSDFEEFALQHPVLLDFSYIFGDYARDELFCDEARLSWKSPFNDDKK